MPYTRPKGKKDPSDLRVGKQAFVYDKSADVYHCPNGSLLTPRSVSKKDGTILYRSSTKYCKKCPLREVCLSKTSSSKTITRSVWQRYMDEVEMIRKTSYQEKYYKLRKQTLERVFADAKDKHGGRYTRYRGLHKVQDYSYLLFATMNMKKMALWSTRKVSLSYLFHHCLGFIDQFKQIKTGLVLQVNF